MTVASPRPLSPGGLLAVTTRIAARQELILVAIIIMTVAMMVLPMPTMMADALIAIDIGMALILILLSLYVRSATELSTLPSLILVTTAFRLSISITTSRLVLVQGDAGAIIRTFGEFVIAGNVVVGLVVYLIITVVQFVVITKGSERVAEVAARFNLDALPGKQMSIDTDVRNGDLTQAQARTRRGQLERESHLYGAMDGAMKFVKGDAIASLVIIAVNLVGGIAIGCLQRGLPFGKAVQTYSLLAVGDGLIAQIPALLVSLTAGLIVTRAVSETGGNLGEDIVRQVTAYARPMQISGIVLAAFGLVPGFPTALFLAIGAAMAGGGLWIGRIQRRQASAEFDNAVQNEERLPEPVRISVVLGAGFAGRLEKVGKELTLLRVCIATELGIAIPRLRPELDSSFGPDSVSVLIDGVSRLRTEVADEQAMLATVRSVVVRCAGELVGVQETQAIVARVEPDYGDLVREAQKFAPLPRLADIIRHLVDEQVSIRNMRAVLEAIADCGQREPSAAGVADHVRVALRRQICLRLADDSSCLALIVLEGALDDLLQDTVGSNPADVLGQLGPDAAQRLCNEITRLRDLTLTSVPTRLGVLSSSAVRRALQTALGLRGIDVAVLCHGEISAEFTTRVVGTVGRAVLDGGTVVDTTRSRRTPAPVMVKAA